MLRVPPSNMPNSLDRNEPCGHCSIGPSQRAVKSIMKLNHKLLRECWSHVLSVRCFRVVGSGSSLVHDR